MAGTRKQPSKFGKVVRTLFFALMLALCVKTVIAESYVAKTNRVEPEVPEGSYVLVYKLGTSFALDQIVAYRQDDEVRLGRIRDVRDSGLTISRNEQANTFVELDQVIGRVVLGTR